MRVTCRNINTNRSIQPLLCPVKQQRKWLNGFEFLSYVELSTAWPSFSNLNAHNKKNIGIQKQITTRKEKHYHSPQHNQHTAVTFTVNVTSGSFKKHFTPVVNTKVATEGPYIMLHNARTNFFTRATSIPSVVKI